MNTVQIYDINVKNDDLQILIDKLKSLDVDIDRIDIFSDVQILDENIRVKRLYEAYGESIFPVTLVNGEIVRVEKHLSVNQIIYQTGVSMKKISSVGIELSNNMCHNDGGCGRACSCGCSKSGCESCNKKRQCHEKI